MLSFEDARHRILSAVAPLSEETVSLDDALGAVLAADVSAKVDVPPFDNSSMDGFAVRAVDVPGTLTVVGDLPAGAAPDRAVGPGEAIRIMTGAPIPPGADEVVPVEVTSVAGGRVVINEARGPGTYVRRAGGDVTARSVVFRAGTAVSAAVVGSIATVGLSRVRVVRRPRVAVMSTGDEVLEVGTTLTAGKILDSNRHALLAAVRAAGFEAIDCGIVGDDEAALEKAVRRAIADADALVTSGGVSVGDYDFVKAVLGRLGSVEFWQVAIRPAKPLAFGLVEGRPVFGLPGNPVSALVSFEEFARPALRKMAGHRLLFRPDVDVVAAEELSGRGDLLVFLRAVVEGGKARLAGGQDSNVLSALAQANAFALLPPGVETVAEGGTVGCRMITWPEDH